MLHRSLQMRCGHYLSSGQGWLSQQRAAVHGQDRFLHHLHSAITEEGNKRLDSLTPEWGSLHQRASTSSSSQRTQSQVSCDV